MNVVARQSFKYSLVGYLGFLLGSVSAVFVFPYDMEFYGKLRYVLSAAEIVLPFVVFGLSYANQKFYLQAEKFGKQSNLLSLSLMAVIFNFIFFLGIYFGFNYLFPNIKHWNFFKAFWDLKWAILPLILILGLSQIYNKYISNFKRIVVPNIFENLFPKLANLGAFLLFFFLSVPEKPALLFFVGVCMLGLIGYAVYLNRLEKSTFNLSLDFIKKDQLWKQILDYGFFGLLGNVGNYLSLRIAGYMIPGYLSFEDNGVYGIILAITSLLTVPQLGLANIAAPIVNRQLDEHKIEELNRFHQKSSLALLYLGIILFSCVLVGFPYLTFLIKNGQLLRAAEPVLWIIGVGLMFDLATGFNSQIISMSKYYRVNIGITLFLAVVNIALLFYFLKYTDLELIGVALATTISLILYNAAKLIFNYWKFQVHPFSMDMLYAVLVCLLAVGIVILIPEFSSHLLNLFFKPFMVLVIVFIGNYYLKIVPLHRFFNKDFFKDMYGK